MPPISGSQPALMTSLSNRLRAGAGRSGYLPSVTAYATVGGIRWETRVLKDITVSKRHDTSAACTFTTKRRLTEATIDVGPEVIISLGSLNNRIFGGYVASVEPLGLRRTTRAPRMQVTCVDYAWLLTRVRVSSRLYQDTPIATVLGNLLSALPSALAFRPNIQGGLSNITFQTSQLETVTAAIDRLASVVGARWWVDEYRVVHFWVSAPPVGAAPAALSSANRHFWGLGWTTDLSQTRTRVHVLGGSSQVTSVTLANSTTIPVADTAVFSAAGGSVVVADGQLTLTYTGKTTSAGAGDLTGVSGLTLTLTEGDEVRVLVTRNDAAAQTALAARIGNNREGAGDSGIIEHLIEDSTLTADQAVTVGDADLAAYKTVYRVLTYKTREMASELGALVSSTITTPLDISGSYRIQAVDITQLGHRTKKPLRTVTAGGTLPPVADLASILSTLY